MEGAHAGHIRRARGGHTSTVEARLEGQRGGKERAPNHVGGAGGRTDPAHRRHGLRRRHRRSRRAAQQRLVGARVLKFARSC